MINSNVLIVEDDSFIAIMLSLLLEDNGYNVIGIYDNAEEAWEACKYHLPGLVLLDVKLMDDKNGVWVAQQIRKNRLPIKIIYLTAFSDYEIVSKIMETCPSMYFTKPFNESVLLSNIKIALKDDRSEILEVIDKGQKILLNTNDILFMRSEGNYIYIFMEGKPFIVIREQLRLIEERILNNWFLRVHQRFLVNLKKVTSVGKQYLQINTHSIPISKPYKEKVREAFKF